MEAKKVVGAFVGMVVRVIIALVVLYYLYHTAITAYSFGYRIFADLPCAIAPGRDIQVTVTDTMDNKEIAREFEKVGLVEDWKLFWVQIQLSEYKDDIQPGTYTLNNSMNSEELLTGIAGLTEETDDGTTDSEEDASGSGAEETIMNNTDDVIVPESEEESNSEVTSQEDDSSDGESE